MTQQSSPATSADSDQQSARKPGLSLSKRLLLLATVVLAAVVVWQMFGDSLTLENLASREASLRQYQQDHPLLSYGAAFAIYVGVTGLSLPGAAVLTLTYAWFLGFLPALILVSFASTAGATIAFLLSRYLLGDSLQRRFADRLQTFNRRLDDEGAFYLFTLRLIPAVPFFVINVVMGLTKLPVVTFWWVSQVGMLPGTAAYVWAGSSVPDLNTLAQRGLSSIISTELVIAFVFLGLFPLAVKKLLDIFGLRKQASSDPRADAARGS